jgi:hypothetical protein
VLAFSGYKSIQKGLRMRKKEGEAKAAAAAKVAKASAVAQQEAAGTDCCCILEFICNTLLIRHAL